MPSRGAITLPASTPHNPVDYRYLDFIFFHGSALDMPPSQLKKVERNYYGEDFERAAINEIGHLDYPQRVLRDYQAISSRGRRLHHSRSRFQDRR